MNNKFVYTLAALSLSTLSACASNAAKPKDIAAPLAISSSNVADADALARMWVDGRRQEINGLAQVKDGEALIRKAQKDERKAAEKLSESRVSSEEQRVAYTRLVAGFSDASTPAAAKDESKELKKAANNWKSATKRVEKEESRLAEAQTRIASSQSSVRTGAEMIASGREKMRSAEMQSDVNFRPAMEQRGAGGAVSLGEIY